MSSLRSFDFGQLRTRERGYIKPNPPADKFHEIEDDGERYLVLHGMVGTHVANTIASARAFGPSADIDRLVRLGAIRPLSDEELYAAAQAGKQVVHDVGFTVMQPLNPMLLGMQSSGTGRPPGFGPGTPGGPPLPEGEAPPDMTAQAGEEPGVPHSPGQTPQPRDPVGTVQPEMQPPPASGNKPISPDEANRPPVASPAAPSTVRPTVG